MGVPIAIRAAWSGREKADHATMPSITIRGRDPLRAVTIAPATLLAPMEGVTDPVFRDCVLPLGGVGAACTEFLRISVAPLPAKVVRKALYQDGSHEAAIARGEPGAARRAPAGSAGIRHAGPPVAVQLMASDIDHLAPSIQAAERVGAAWIDLNFGCPAPIVFNKCAGSGLLDHPERLASIVRTAVAATGLAVSAKLRVGITSPARLDELMLAAAEAGAAMITLHARLRCQSYAEPSTWSWIAQAKRTLVAAGHTVPLVGNGSVEAPGDVARMRRETGCDAVMIGRGALADPWIFAQAGGGPGPTPAMALDFARGYAATVTAARGERVAVAKLKQLARWYRCGGLFAGEAGDQRRRELLRRESLIEVMMGLEAEATQCAVPA